MTGVFPRQLKQHDPRTLHIRWSDGKCRKYAVYEIRIQCKCAHCCDEFTGKRILDIRNVSSSIYPKKIVPVGNYALQFVWSDGHDSGIYPFESLYQYGIEIDEAAF